MVGNNSNLEIFNRIKETNSNNADEYSNSKTYVKDEYCIYNNTLYKANQAIDTAEEFTESHWTETTVGTELKSQADSISALNSRNKTKVSLVDMAITSSNNVDSIDIPNYSDYEYLFITISGDDNNGISIYIPKVFFDVNVPFSLYSANQNALVVDSGYSVRAHGRILNGKVILAYVNVTGWQNAALRVYGIK